MGTLCPLFLYFSISLFLTLAAAQQSGGWLADPCINGLGKITTNSAYHTDLNQLLSSFTSLSPNNSGFYNVSAGQNPDQVNAIALCRGDVKPDVCLKCVIDVATELKNSCLTKKASQYYDNCMVRYSEASGNSIAGFPVFYNWGEGANATNASAFNGVLTTLLGRMRTTAAGGDSIRKYAQDSATAPPSEPIYASVQCTPDLTQQQCSNCLSEAFTYIQTCCQDRRGGRIFGPSCIVRFSDTLFYSTSAPNEPSSSPPPLSTTIIIIIVIASAGFFILLISICICIFFRGKKSKKKFESEILEDVDEIEDTESLQYDFDTIKTATSNFSPENKLGQGGFGAVYKGRLANGQEIAVKRLSIGSGQGDLEFRNEVQLVAKLQHRNLVKLHGFCLEGKERLLIYEFVPNSSLDRFLFDPTKRKALDWGTPYKIIGGIVKGLLYLHEDSRLRIIHRDLKASNILLDVNMNPKISDFGTARLFVADQTQDATSKVVGTYGYMAPEYIRQGQVSVKTDIYSFGVLILEIICGQKINYFCHEEAEDNLINEAWRNWREGTALNIVDPNLKEGSRDEMMRCIHIGLLCVQENVARRPTMGSIVEMLTSYSVSLPTPSRPSFLSSEATRSHQSINGSGLASKNEVSITKLDPR